MYPAESFVLKDFLVPMKDGVRLYTQAAMPAASGTYPIVFIRNPYVEIQPTELGREDISSFPYHLFLENGYAVVYQHCRGTGRSEGDFIPFLNEHDDGLATLDWIRTQPFYEGSVFLTGGSYLGAVQLHMLADCGDDVKGACMNIMHDDIYSCFYQNGFLKLGLLHWFTDMYKKRTLSDRVAGNYSYPDSFKTRPFSDYAMSIFGEEAETHKSTYDHPRADDPYWESIPGLSSARNAARKCRVPILMCGGWHDVFIGGMCRMWEELPEETREQSAFIIGPWGHGLTVFDGCGFPLPDGNCPDNLNLSWFEYLRRKADVSFISPENVRQYEFNGAGWKTIPFIPGKNELTLRFSGDQKLTSGNPLPGSFTRAYDPENPASFPGTCHSLDGCIIQKQPGPDFRDDVITFISEPFAEETVIQGDMSVLLSVMSDCEDTSFYVRVSAVIDGDAWLLRDAITSIRYEYPDTPYIPGTPVELPLRLDPISFRLKPGNQLRVDVSFSNFPVFLPHTNTAGLWAEQTESKVAHNTIFCEGSYIRLTTD